MPQKNSLFNYFVKSPKSKSNNKENEDQTAKNKTTNDQKLTKNATPKKDTHHQKYELGDMIWAKLDGYPWWPSLVCNDPDTNKYFETKSVHVQFFDEEPSRAWIDLSKTSIYKGSKRPEFEAGGNFYTHDLNVISATKLADEHLNSSTKDRLKLVVFTQDGKKRKFETSAEENESQDYKNEVTSSRKKKRSRIIESESDGDVDEGSENEFVCEEEETETSDDDLSCNPTSDEDSEKEEEVKQPAKKRKIELKTTVKSNLKAFNSSTLSSPVISSQTKAKLSRFEATSTGPDMTPSKYLHETLDFLQPDKISDIKGRKISDPNYDKTTLQVPESFMKKLTPAMFQWWNIKKQNFNVVLFFKVGKFYELYHMDATVGVKELGLIYMKGAFAHSGFPEISFGRYSSILVQKGYVVARVEQTETPEQNQARTKGRSVPKQEKTLRREICRITTKGTQIASGWVEDSVKTENNYLLSVIERPIDRDEITSKTNLRRVFGICFVDTSVGMFHLGEFYDDRSCSTLCTMIAHYTPCQILFERGKISTELRKILQTGLASAVQTPLTPGTQFWNATKTLKHVSDEKYFVKEDEEIWPQVLKEMTSDSDSLGLTPKDEFKQALSAFGACVFYLRKCLIDFEVISMKQFQLYDATQYKSVSPKQENKTPFKDENINLVLDSVTLANLEVVLNSKGKSDGSLLSKIDNCQTPFGKRLLRQWVCSPSCDPNIINNRLDAIESLLENVDIMKSMVGLFKKIPDLERMLARIHSMSKGSRKANHPDNRAILYEEDKYSKKKIADFISILNSYESVHSYLKETQNEVGEIKSPLLRSLIGLKGVVEDGQFPDLENILTHWKKAFNHKKAKETGKITPNPGTNKDFDMAISDIKDIDNDLADYLEEQKKILGCFSVSYKGSGNKRFQLELPISATTKKLPHDYIISGQRKGFKSFRTDQTAYLLKKMEDAESRKATAQAETMSIVFHEFDKDFKLWDSAVRILGVLDVLISLAHYSKGSDGIMCRPNMKFPENNQAKLIIKSARHPCISKTIYSDEFIPNDTILGENTQDPKCILLSGPNMGGKSTLMRQVGLVVILAHLGSYVPAEECELTPCDRIFTRLGASDRIMSGESTFYVELSETCNVLKHATNHSLVLLDELGRGTATYDGTAIATAVLSDISEKIKCRSIFSTHYHTLIDDFVDNSAIKLGHMACMVENEGNEDEENLTFLYKLVDGACPKSYGFHAALLAKIPNEIVKLARVKAKELEDSNRAISSFRNVWNLDSEDPYFNNKIKEILV